MTAFKSRWLDWEPAQTPTQQTDNTDKSPSVSFVSVAPGRLDSRAHEAAVAAWINTHPPTQRDSETCAACGAALGAHFVVLGDGAAVHYSGPHGLRCWERYQHQRRREAEAELGQ